MCGIFGTIEKEFSQEALEKATSRMAFRGPDDVGYFVEKENGVYLGHRRLSIIDLSSLGHQPFVDNSGRYVMVYNGEIYNYIELKNELKDRYDFKTQSDSEVLMASYLVFGEDCVKHLNGMFAFAIYDRKEKSLFAARDRAGEKPLFYTEVDGGLMFASEIKALLSHRKFLPNEKIIQTYLTFGVYEHSDETFFSGIYSLPPGHTLTYQNGKKSVRSYWELSEISTKYDYKSDEEVIETFKELVFDSIKLRFRSDVPVGINLSSGLDSNILYAFAKKAMGPGIHTFSMCYVDDAYNECPLIEALLSKEEQSLWHTSTLYPEEFVEAALKMNLIQDQPYGGVPTLAYGKLMNEAKKAEVKVLLEGQGLDELLAGYAYMREAYERDLGLNNQKANAAAAYSQDKTVMIHKNILSTKVTEVEEPDFAKPFNSHLLNAQYRDFRHTKLPRVLRFNDHASMAESRELRLPFLDHRLVEFCINLPVKYKIDELTAKVLGRQVYQSLFPLRKIEPVKKAFGAVQNSWFRSHGKEFIMDTINSDSFKVRGYYDQSALLNEAERFFKGEGENSFFLWQAVNLELWFRTHFK